MYCLRAGIGAMAGRPRFAARTREDAEDFFISSLARWRDTLGLDKVLRAAVSTCLHETAGLIADACVPGGSLVAPRELQAVSKTPPFAETTLCTGEFAVNRIAVGLVQVILVGHSLGGYLAASYALKHPEHVQHLVLVGPAGVVSL